MIPPLVGYLTPARAARVDARAPRKGRAAPVACLNVHPPATATATADGET